MAKITLTRSQWKTFKTDHHLSKSKLFAKADVGPTIDSLQKAQKAYTTSPSAKTLGSYFEKLDKLNKAMTKFVALKKNKDELTNGDKAMKKIEGWKQEISKQMKHLADYQRDNASALAQSDVQSLKADFKTMGF